MSWSADFLAGASLASVEFDLTASSARLVFAGAESGTAERLATAAIGVRQAILGGASATLPSPTVVKAWPPEQTHDGFQIVTFDMDDGGAILLVADDFKIVPSSAL